MAGKKTSMFVSVLSVREEIGRGSSIGYRQLAVKSVVSDERLGNSQGGDGFDTFPKPPSNTGT